MRRSCCVNSKSVSLGYGNDTDFDGICGDLFVCLKIIWWDCVKDDMESLGLSQKDAQFRDKWRRRIKGATG